MRRDPAPAAPAESATPAEPAADPAACALAGPEVDEFLDLLKVRAAAPPGAALAGGSQARFLELLQKYGPALLALLQNLLAGRPGP